MFRQYINGLCLCYLLTTCSGWTLNNDVRKEEYHSTLRQHTLHALVLKPENVQSRRHELDELYVNYEANTINMTDPEQYNRCLNDSYQVLLDFLQGKMYAMESMFCLYSLIARLLLDILK